ncbi:MAG: FAD-dependent oxidoreductase [Candidatus Auribacterota bacterium]
MTRHTDAPRIVILGTGPTGLGAAYHLYSLGYTNWSIYEQESYVGGLSASFRDSEGFIWDQGGHVTFSHYKFFDELLDFSCKDNLLSHTRNASAYMCNRFVPYPVQNNIRYLPEQKILSCVNGLLDRDNAKEPHHFADWIQSVFGSGLADLFMTPYNEKVWSYPLDKMGFNWISERVSVIDIKKVLETIILRSDDTGWGPNNTFVYPLKGGIQAIYLPVQKCIGGHLLLNKKTVKIDLKKKTVFFSDGSSDAYEYLISTIPLDVLIATMIDLPEYPIIKQKAESLVYNTVMITGLGIARKNDVKRCWIYFPEKEFPWYRVTYFSNYSPHNVPGDNYFSLMGEISYPSGACPDRNSVIESSINAYIRCGILRPEDRDWIVSKYTRLIPRAYPVPSLERDSILSVIQPFLMDNDIFSRGRFGGWKYEVANMDHSVMQGKEAVDAILFNKTETVYDMKE